jgi:hypothetical protein
LFILLYSYLKTCPHLQLNRPTPDSSSFGIALYSIPQPEHFDIESFVL